MNNKIITSFFSYTQVEARPGRFDAQSHIITNTKAHRAPVLRLFCRGLDKSDTTSSVLLHVHGYYPYFFVQLPDELVARLESPEAFLKTVANAVEQQYVLNGGELLELVPNAVHAMEYVSGLPFTGYHVQDRLFLKIYVTDPRAVVPVANLFRFGHVFMRMHVFETHIALFTKFVKDCALSLEQPIAVTGCVERTQASGLKVSTCDFEFDCCVSGLSSDLTPRPYAGPTQYNPRLEASLKTQQLVRSLERRTQLIEAWNLSQQADEVDAGDEQPQEKQVQLPETDEMQTQEDDVALFDKMLDGGPGEQGLEESSSGESGVLSSEVPRDNTLRAIHYSNEKDIPRQPFQWAGLTYDFRGQQDDGPQEQKPSLGEESQQAVSMDSNDEIEQNECNRQSRVKMTLRKEQLDELNRKGCDLEDAVSASCQQQSNNDARKGALAAELLSRVSQQGAQDLANQFMKFCVLEISVLNDCAVAVFFDTLDLESSDVLRTARVKIYAVDEPHSRSIEQLQSDVAQLFGSWLSGSTYELEIGSFEEVFTQKLPLAIQLEDPDVILSWRHNYNGVGKASLIGAACGVDFLGRISRVPGRQSSWYSNAKQFCGSNSPEGLAAFVAKNGASRLGIDVQGRMVLEMRGLAQHKLKLNTGGIQEILDRLEIGRRFPLRNDAVLQQLLRFRKEQLHAAPERETRGQKERNGAPPVWYEVLWTIQYAVYAGKVFQALECIWEMREMSRFFRVPMADALSRGSQFKVDSFLFNAARAQNYILGPSPTRAEVARMQATEAIPLVAEPRSGFYEHPMLVFDFTSLYPSVMCAFNYCYTTVFKNFSAEQQIGPFLINFHTAHFKALAEQQNSYFQDPNDYYFVDAHTRRGILPSIITECLELRAKAVAIETECEADIEQLQFYRDQVLHNHTFAKQTGNPAPEAINPDVLEQALIKLRNKRGKAHARQAAIKSLITTMYGYTSATFSGRMPCSQIADAIVETSRRVLESCIRLVEAKYGCQVVYADTDSMFVSTKQVFAGVTSKTELLRKALNLGEAIRLEINALVRPPIKIKLERIYMPCLLVTKKRYAGQSFSPTLIKRMYGEAFSDIPASIDAKGIEPVRRDLPWITRQAAAGGLRVVFGTTDLSALRRYFLEVFTRFAVTDFSGVNINQLIIYRKTNAAGASGHADSEQLQAGGRKPRAAAQIISQHASNSLLPERGERVGHVTCLLQQGQEKGVAKAMQEPQRVASGAAFPHFAYYLERQLVNPCHRLFAGCGFSVESVRLEFGWFILRHGALLEELLQDDFDSSCIRQLMPFFSTLDYTGQTADSDPELLQLFYASAKKANRAWPLPRRPCCSLYNAGLLRAQPYACIVCGAVQPPARITLCPGCKKAFTERGTRALLLHAKRCAARDAQAALSSLLFECIHCTGCAALDSGSHCTSCQCPNRFSIWRLQRQVEQLELEISSLTAEQSFSRAKPPADAPEPEPEPADSVISID